MFIWILGGTSLFPLSLRNFSISIKLAGKYSAGSSSESSGILYVSFPWKWHRRISRSFLGQRKIKNEGRIIDCINKWERRNWHAPEIGYLHEPCSSNNSNSFVSDWDNNSSRMALGTRFEDLRCAWSIFVGLASEHRNPSAAGIHHQNNKVYLTQRVKPPPGQKKLSEA